MIRISRKADYAIVLMTYLARQATRADHSRSESGFEDMPVSAHELASAIPIGKSTIANLLKLLARGEVLESVRGVHGGYRLARPAREISLAQILEAIDGPVAIVDCANVIDIAEAPCELASCCTTHRPMHLLQQRIVALLEHTKLDEFGSSCPLPKILQAIPQKCSS